MNTKKTFNRNVKPKSRQTTQVDIGVPFVGSFDRVYRYLGTFECTQDDTYDANGDISERTDYTGKTVHVYHECHNYGHRQSQGEVPNDPFLYVSKSKMNVKSLEIPDDHEMVASPSKGTVSTDCGSKCAYGTGYYTKCVIDFEARTIKYVKKAPPRNKDFRGRRVPYFR